MMKSSLGKLKRFAMNKSDDAKERKNHHPQTLAHLDGLAQAAQDMKDIRSYYDSLLSAAAASANSAYEFSESLLEMGNCLLQKTALNDDGDCGRGLSMLGRVQLDLRKIVDSYRAYIILTITKPSESLLDELRKVEEMKLQCDEKREVYEYLLTQHRDKGRSRGGKGDSVTSEQLQAAREEYDDVARLCVFRVESLKQGQCRSLFTQAARHHAAQLNFFRRGLESLEAVEPHLKTVALKQHIDYQLSGLGDVENEDGEDVTSYESNDDEDLSFDYGLNKQEIHNAGTLRNLVEVDAPGMQTSATEDAATSMGRSQGEQLYSQQSRAGSHSAPIYAEKFDFAEKIKDAQTTVRKFHTHVLPTPADAKGWNSRTSNSLLNPSSTGVSGGSNNNLWHSSPLQTEKQRRSTEDNLLARNTPKSLLVDIDSNNSNPPIPLPPLAEGVPLQQSDARNEFDYEKLKRLAFSGPIASKTPSSKPSLYSSGQVGSSEQQHLNSGLFSRVPIGQLPSSINVSHGASPPPVSSPRISELHELPRPPGSIASKPGGSGVIGQSIPLGTNKREVSPTNRSSLVASNAGSALPPPPLTVPRSFSIPSSSQRAMAIHVAKLLESPRSRGRSEEVASRLTPISLANMKSEVASNSGHIKVNAGGR